MFNGDTLRIMRWAFSVLWRIFNIALKNFSRGIRANDAFLCG